MASEFIILIRKKRDGTFQKMSIKRQQWTNPTWKQKQANALLVSNHYRELEPGESVEIKGLKLSKPNSRIKEIVKEGE